ncbi:MAG: hypothetical protein OXD47_11075 [Gammaproteobacteria bacterium]|nr:hypothetical protein [Gammaproteobacteria bacterium]MCY4339315.1 hypothetical protein [Gammaproteobacteria bacterium]
MTIIVNSLPAMRQADVDQLKAGFIRAGTVQGGVQFALCFDCLRPPNRDMQRPDHEGMAPIAKIHFIGGSESDYLLQV